MSTLSVTIGGREKAAGIIASLNLEASNRVLADYWLSLWQDDEPPLRAKLSPLRLKAFLSNLILFDVKPDVGVTVRLAGTAYRHILGTELTGEDWIALAPESHRETRLRTFSTIARGAVCVVHRLIAMTVGDDYVSEEIILPFAADADGTRLLLVHVNWKPEQFLKIKSIAQVTGDPLDVKVVPLR